MIAEIDIADDELEHARQALIECLEGVTGCRPRTKTILAAQLEIALKPPDPFKTVNGNWGNGEHTYRIRRARGQGQH